MRVVQLLNTHLTAIRTGAQDSDGECRAAQWLAPAQPSSVKYLLLQPVPQWLEIAGSNFLLQMWNFLTGCLQGVKHRQ